MGKLLKKCDKFLLVMLIIYALLGLVMIFSASSVSTVLRYHVSPSHFFIRQLIFLVLSLVAGVFILFFPTKNYKFVSFLYAVGVIVMLVGLFAYGQLTNHAQSWYNFGPISLQPSEFAKTALIIFMACFYDRLYRSKVKNITLYFFPLALTLVYAILVILQPDLGSAIILLAIGFGTFLSIPIIKRNFMKVFKFLIIGVVIVGIWFLYSGADLLNSRQMSRLKFQNPCSRYTEETGYQVCNGFIAINNGGLLGAGLGNSTQKYLYLPESHTDFIFPIIVEELGLIVGVLIVIGYLAILLRILKIAKSTYNLRNSILCYGSFIYLASHILINLCGILALIPLTGVPLPLLSYGGSYTINVVLTIFVILRVSIENNNTEIKKELKSITN